MKRILIQCDRKVEHHLLSNRTFVIDGRLERSGAVIYLDRSYVEHPSIAAMRSIILPAKHLWILFFEGHHAPHPSPCYIHIARITDNGQEIMIEDLYLDIVVDKNGSWRLLDVDEFRGAIAQGELSMEQIQSALAGLEHASGLVADAGKPLEKHIWDWVIGQDS